jgi:hypothetical protein
MKGVLDFMSGALSYSNFLFTTQKSDLNQMNITDTFICQRAHNFLSASTIIELSLTKYLTMTNEQIAKFLEPSHLTKNSVKIEFKTRQAITGLFIKAPDYNELKSKNFWRIVTGTYITQWETSKDNNLAKIFNGAEFTRLSAI